MLVREYGSLYASQATSSSALAADRAEPGGRASGWDSPGTVPDSLETVLGSTVPDSLDTVLDSTQPDNTAIDPASPGVEASAPGHGGEWDAPTPTVSPPPGRIGERQFFSISSPEPASPGPATQGVPEDALISGDAKVWSHADHYEFSATLGFVLRRLDVGNFISVVVPKKTKRSPKIRQYGRVWSIEDVVENTYGIKWYPVGGGAQSTGEVQFTPEKLADLNQREVRIVQSLPHYILP